MPASRTRTEDAHLSVAGRERDQELHRSRYVPDDLVVGGSSRLDFRPPRLLRDHQKEDGRGPAEDRPVRRHHARALLEVSGHVLHYLGRVRGGGEVRKISEGQRYVRQRVVHGRYRREDGREEPRPCEALDDVARESSEHEAYGYRRHEDEEERRGQLE